MKFLLPFFLVALLIASCKKVDEPAPVVEMLKNANMETNDGASPDNWSFYKTGGPYLFSWSTDESTSPIHSLKVANDTLSLEYGYWAQQYPGTTIPVGKDLLFAVKIKAKKLSGKGVSLVIRAIATSTSQGQTGQMTTTQNVTNIVGTFDWTTYSVALPGLHNDIKTITVALVYLDSTTGQVYFDDASLMSK